MRPHDWAVIRVRVCVHRSRGSPAPARIVLTRVSVIVPRGPKQRSVVAAHIKRADTSSRRTRSGRRCLDRSSGAGLLSRAGAAACLLRAAALARASCVPRFCCAARPVCWAWGGRCACQTEVATSNQKKASEALQTSGATPRAIEGRWGATKQRARAPLGAAVRTASKNVPTIRRRLWRRMGRPASGFDHHRRLMPLVRTTVPPVQSLCWLLRGIGVDQSPLRAEIR